MTICDSCHAHVARRNKAFLPLVNIPAPVLKSLSIDQLIEVRSIAQSGAMLCTDCARLCRSVRHRDECPSRMRSHKVKTAVQWRRAEDVRVIKAVDAEVAKRKKVLLARLQSGRVPGNQK